MNVLIDTHAFMWFVNGDEKISNKFIHTMQLIDLPLHHRDPFDRLIIAQAMAENLAIITKDQNIKHYPVEIIW